MKKLNYITRQFNRTARKRFEHYVTTRVWHLLNDSSLKFVTQQYVVIPGGRALTDMFFPQLHVHIEVDEPYHLNQFDQDKLREADIVNATNHKILRIDVSKGLEDINEQINEVVRELKHLKSSVVSFIPWDPDLEQSSDYHIDRGYIDAEEDICFKHSYRAANCFGHRYKGLQQASSKHPFEENKIIWFPKLYPNSGWINTISDDDETIVEKSIHSTTHTQNILNGSKENRIVFARVRSPLGDVMYRFKGEYKLNTNLSNIESGLIWERIKKRVSTYKPK